MTELEGPTSEESAATSVSVEEDEGEEQEVSNSLDSSRGMDSTAGTLGPTDTTVATTTEFENVPITLRDQDVERARSPSVFSDTTKPDPPSILEGEDVSDAMPRGNREDPQIPKGSSPEAHSTVSSAEMDEKQAAELLAEFALAGSSSDKIPSGMVQDRARDTSSESSAQTEPPVSTIETGDSTVAEGLEEDDEDNDGDEDMTNIGETEDLTVPSLSTNSRPLVYDAPSRETAAQSSGLSRDSGGIIMDPPHLYLVRSNSLEVVGNGGSPELGQLVPIIS